MECNRLVKKKQKNARQRASKIMSDVQKDDKIKEKYKFDKKLVGSGHWGTMIETKDNTYDIDYQLLLTKNSKEYKDNKYSDPTGIKRDFYEAFDRYKKEHESIENKTTAVTLISNEYNFHIDFVIIDNNSYPNKIIRRNNKEETPSSNEFTWNELADRSEAFDYFKQMEQKDKEELINNKIVPAKCEESQKDDGDLTKKSSSEIFIEEIMRWKNEH